MIKYSLLSDRTNDVVRFIEVHDDTRSSMETWEVTDIFKQYTKATGHEEISWLT